MDLKTSALAAVAVCLALAAPQSAEAGNVRFPFKNATVYTIEVVMDTEREVHRIAPGSVANFQEASLGDAPTFRVYAVNPDGTRGPCVGVDKFPTLRLFGAGGRDLTWDGGRIRD